MNVYDDNHPLGKPVHDADVMINAATFFMEIQQVILNIPFTFSLTIHS